MAKNKDAIFHQAEIMFIELGNNAKTIAEAFDLTEQTVGRWRAKHNWDQRRDEVFASPHKLREILLKEMRWIADGNDPRFDTDALSKVNKVFEGFGSKITPQIVMSVMKMLDEWLADSNPQLANANLDSHKKFIMHMINLHG